MKPGRQLQWKELTPSMQEPPLRHGSDGTERGKLWSGQVNVQGSGVVFDSNRIL